MDIPGHPRSVLAFPRMQALRGCAKRTVGASEAGRESPAKPLCMYL